MAPGAALSPHLSKLHYGKIDRAILINFSSCPQDEKGLISSYIPESCNYRPFSGTYCSKSLYNPKNMKFKKNTCRHI